MRKLWVGLLLLAAGTLMPARAALVCATPQEMKLLQSAVLQQQLAAAAMACRMTADYGAFVAAYRERLVVADQALQAFFASRPRGESYVSYKTRIAANVSLTQRDPRFCESAQKVFDIALGRGAERRGLAPEPPRLIDTGYEGCRPVADELMQAAMVPRPQPRPEIKLAAVPKPVMRPAVAKPEKTQIARASTMPFSPSASHALALSPHAGPRPLLAAAGGPIPVTRVAPKAAALPPAAAAKPVLVAKAESAPLPPARLVAIAPPEMNVQPEGKAASLDNPARPLPDSEPAWTEPEEPASRYAAVERPQWQRPQPYARYDQRADDHIPNAYRPGAEWIGDTGPAWAPASYPPPRRSPPHYLVQAPDGHWVVVIGHQPAWARQ